MVGVIIGTVGLLFVVRQAKSVADDNFRVTMPYYDDNTNSTNVYLEIAQVGTAVKLDAQESWAKIYIDKDRIDETTIGIYKGGYGDTVDQLGLDSGGSGRRIGDRADAVKYEFYLGVNYSIPGTVYKDEIPCRVEGSDVLALGLTSAQMPVDGWYKDLRASRFYNNASCGGAKWAPTDKSGKYVLFVKASWNTPQPVEADGKTKIGRLNAFKVGAAYDNPKDQYDNPITGYYSFLGSALSPSMPTRGVYSVQDRVSPDRTPGDYTFQFGADCRLAVGQSEERYLHWKDVDYPDYYPGLTAPEFYLYKISPSGVKSQVVHVTKDSDLPDGVGYPFNGLDANGKGLENIHKFYKFTAQGGYKYQWVWKNIVRKDGVSLWLPYDDYPSLAGCGEYEYSQKLRAGAGAPADASNFEVDGGRDVVINLQQFWKGTSAGADITADLYVKAANKTPVPIATTFSGVTATLGGKTVNANPNIRQLEWKLPRLGPSGTYSSSNDKVFATFKVRDDAPDGAGYCISSTIAPHTQVDGTAVQGTPDQICFTINNALRPYVTTEAGDVHAGDCNVAAGPLQTITGITTPTVSRGSSGSYIVSAADNIGSFGSAGDANSTNLRFGKRGYYGRLCRPLLADMNPLTDKNATVINGDATSNDYNLGDLAPGKRYVVKFFGDARVYGTSRAPVTVYAPNGTVTLLNKGSNIVGSATGTKVSARKDLPVVGITAKNIKISKDVAGVVATAYATGTIDTCAEVPNLRTAANVAACRSTLLWSGFAMAHDFSFKRTSTGTNGMQLAEYIKFNAGFYLNPPPGYSAAAGSLRYLGERAPLY